MRRIVRPYLPAELGEVVDWYNERSPGLGERFFEEVEKALARIDETPYLYRTVHLDIRRAPVERFPYGVYYAVIDDTVHVLAVVHDARHPSVWKRRR